ncbi:hypothetical protein NUSPORA_00716 [Nucleospora cyclopteri]
MDPNLLFFKHSPFHKDRIKYIQKLSPTEIVEEKGYFINCLKDENSDVIIEVIKAWTKKIQEGKNFFNDDLLEKTHNLITHRNVIVRRKYAKILRKFTKVSDKFKERLFDKDDIGLFIYAVEDEDRKVKKHVIKALQYFLIPAAVNFLIDMLNEDSKSVRIVVSSVLRRVTEIKRKEGIIIKCSAQQMKYILISLEESNNKIKTNILNVLANVSYTRENLFFELLEKRNINEIRKIKALKKIVINNFSLFDDYLNKNFNFVIENDFSLHDKSYFGYLIILGSIMKCFPSRDFHLSHKVREDLKFIKFKLKSQYCKHKNRKYHQFLTENNFVTENSFNSHFYTFKCRFLVPGKILDFEETDEIMREFVKFNIEKVETTTTEKDTTNFIDILLVDLFNLFYNFSSKSCLKQPKRIFYMLSVASSIKKFSNRPLIFEIKTFYEQKKPKTSLLSNLSIILTNGEDFLIYPIQAKLVVTLNEPEIDEIQCFIGLPVNDKIIRLSEISILQIIE